MRHAKAGERGSHDDHLRPLSPAGRRQALGLVEQLGPCRLERLLTSPYSRCRQTIEPLAAARGLTLEDSQPLAEGGSCDLVLQMMAELASPGAVLCSHGDVIGGVLVELAERGVIPVGELRAAKGSTWLIEYRAGRPHRASYLAPPI